MKVKIFDYVVRHDLSVISSDNFDEIAGYLFEEFKGKANDLNDLREDIADVLNELKYDYED